MRPTFRPIRTTAPEALPVTLAEAKAHLRVDFSDDDTLISACLAAAVDHLDGWTGVLGRCLMSQTWRQDFDGICHTMRLPMPALSVAEVVYTATDGAAVTIDAAEYSLHHDARGSFVDLLRNKGLPALADVVAPVRISAVYGFGDADSVPAPIKAAIRLMVGDLYANRETVAAGQVGEVPMSTTVNALISPFRRVPA